MLYLPAHVKQLLILPDLFLVVLPVHIPLLLWQYIKSAMSAHLTSDFIFKIIKMAIELVCYASLAVLTAVNFFYALPIWLNTSSFSMLIIIAGSHRSLDEMIA